MTKKENEKKIREDSVKMLGEMTDAEFLANADKLAEPYYFDYFFGERKLDRNADGYISKSDMGIFKVGAKTPVKAPVTPDKSIPKVDNKAKHYVKKHVAALVVILIFSLAFIAVGALGQANFNGTGKYLSLYKTESGDISLLDPVVALVDSFAHTGAKNFYTPYFEGVSGKGAVPVYAVSAAVLLSLLFALAEFIKSMCALCSGKKDDGYYKKFRFGYISVVMFLCGVTATVGGIYVGGLSIADVLSFIKPGATDFGAGYALYAMLGVPVITFICACCSYKKEKAVKNPRR